MLMMSNPFNPHNHNLEKLQDLKPYFTQSYLNSGRTHSPKYESTFKVVEDNEMVVLHH